MPENAPFSGQVPQVCHRTSKPDHLADDHRTPFRAVAFAIREHFKIEPAKMWYIVRQIELTGVPDTDEAARQIAAYFEIDGNEFKDFYRNQTLAR